MASLADVAPDSSADMSDPDDASMSEDEDMKSSAEDVLAAIKSGDADALVTALEAFVLSVK